MVCLDTSFIIDLMRDNPQAVNTKQRLEKINESLTIASPTIIELIRGLETIRLGKREKENINEFMNSVATLPLDKKSAIKAGNIELELMKKGQKIDIEDLMIGAITIVNKEKLITRNEDHFNRIKELDYETY